MDPYETNHDSLRRLLALKRHEVPPPGFFERLPYRVLVNIRAGSEIPDQPWWVRCWETIVREPMVVSSYAALAMGALLFGVSVFQTSVESETPPELASQESGVAFYEFEPPVASTASLPRGVIYRADVPGSLSWTRTTATPIGSSGLARVYGIGWDPAQIPGVPVTETAFLRTSR